MKICINCGKELPDVFTFCLKCHSSLIDADGQNEPVSPCPECGGERSIANVMVYGYDSSSLLLTQPSVKNSRNLESKASELSARVCHTCGYTAFYAKRPLNLLVRRPDLPISGEETAGE